ncbi:MAG: xanthine dehydrogenase small subunit [Nannocystaceae bacterium]
MAVHPSAAHPIQFELNGAATAVSGLPPTTTLLAYLREHAGLVGTREGCAEGDCGACSIAILEIDPDLGSSWRTVNACLILLPTVHGKTIRTIEGVGSTESPHCVQEALVRHHGSQCGYCTPGVVMSLFEAHHRTDLDEAWKFDDQLCGNLCRCTGYRSIRAALHEIAGRGARNPTEVQNEHKPRTPGDVHYTHNNERFIRPQRWSQLWEAMDTYTDHTLVAGGTDLGLEVTKKHRRFPCLIGLDGLAELSQLSWRDGTFRVGATVRLSVLERAASERLPMLARMLRYFGSRQIKNRATAGGNLCHASPVGDLAPVVLALGGALLLRSRESERRVKAEDFFIGYRKTALRIGELLVAIELPLPAPGVHVGAYKVSKRRELDISTTSAAFWVEVERSGIVARARIAFGGLARTPRRAHRVETALTGTPWCETGVVAAAAQLAHEFTPVDDVRGSAWYRLKLAQNLLLGFYHETLSPRAAGPTPARPCGTVLP